MRRIARNLLGLLLLWTLPVHAVMAGDEKWTLLETPPGGAVYSFVADGDRMFFAAASEVYESTDAGSTWAEFATFESDVHAFAFDPSDPHRFYVSTDAGILKSVDGGDNWVNIGEQFAYWEEDDIMGIVDYGPKIIELAVSLDGRHVYARNHDKNYGTRNRVYVQTDGGEWNQILDDDYELGVLRIDPLIPSRLYAVPRNYGADIMRSDDAGTTWESVTWDPSLTCAGEPVKPYDFQVDPEDSQRLFVTGLYTCPFVIRSENGGEDWEIIDIDFPAAGFEIGEFIWDISLVFDPSDSHTMYATYYHTEHGVGMLRSIDGGNTWDALPDTSRNARGVMKVSVSDPQTRVIAGSRGVWRTTDDGNSWTASTQGFGLPGYNRHFERIAGTAEGLMVLTNAGIARSEDGGANWSLLPAASHPHFNELRAFAVNPIDPEELWLSFDTELVRTTDGGESWSMQDLHPPTNPEPRFTQIAVNPTDPRNVIVKNSNDSHAYVTTTSGSTWNSVYVGEFHEIAFSQSDDRIFLAAGYSGIRRSANGGTSWSNKGPGGNASSIVVDPDDSDIVYAITAEGLHKSLNGGEDWTLMEEGAGGKLAIDPNDGSRLLLATALKIRASKDGGQTWAQLPTPVEGGGRQVEQLLFDPVVSDRYFITLRLNREPYYGASQVYLYDGELPDPPAQDTEPDDGQEVDDGPVQSSSGGGVIGWSLSLLICLALFRIVNGRRNIITDKGKRFPCLPSVKFRTK